MTEAGLLRKTVYFSPGEWNAIRQRAFEEDRPYTDVIRGVIRRGLGIRHGKEEKPRT